MPSVGTLNLSVQSNAGDVGRELEQVAGALGRIKKALPENGLGLSGIANEIGEFIKEVNKIKSASAVFKSIEQLGNGLKGIATAVKYSTDSIKEASDGTNKVVSSINTKPLVDAIKAVKTAVGKGFNIGMAGTQLLKIKDAIGGEWNTEKAKVVGEILRDIADAAKAVGKSDLASVASVVSTVAKSLNEYTNATDKTKDAIGSTSDAITEVKKNAEAYEGTMTRLQQLMGKRANIQLFGGGADSVSSDWRSSLMGQWDFAAGVEAETAKLKDIVTQIQITDAVMQKVADNVSNVGDRFSSAISEEAVIAPIRMISESFREAEKYIRYYESGIDAILPKINQLSSEHMIEAGNAKLAAMSEKELRVAILDAQGELPSARIMSPVQLEDVQNVQQFNIELQETGDIIQSVVIPRFDEMYRVWSMFAYEFGAFQMQATRLTAGNNPLLLGDGRTPGQLLLGDGSEPETFLSTWVRVGEEFKTNWVMFTSDAAEQWRAQWSPDWILGGWNVPQSMSTFHIGAGESPLLLGDGGVSPENMMSTVVDTSEQWKQNWIVGEGYVADVIQKTEAVTEATEKTTDAAEEYEAVFQRILAAKEKEARIAEEKRSRQEASFYGGGEKKSVLGMDQTNAMADNLTQLDLLKSQLHEAEVQYNKFVNELGAGDSKTIKAGLAVQSLRDKIWEYTKALEEAKEEQEETGHSAISLSGAWNTFKSGIEKMFPTLTGLLKRFKQIVKYRLLRSVLRHITSGFTEGVKNVYQYSKAVGTDLAPAMDRGASALAQMKNSIGAAAAPVIQALVPVLQNVVSWFINLLNYANQFFALLNGQKTWTRALPQTTEAFGKQEKAAKKTGAAIKDLLADWDELNIIQSNTSGAGAGAGTSTAEDYINMFEEVNQFDSKVKDVINWIKDNLGLIENIAKKIGLAILGWKMSKAFTGFLGTLGKLIAGGALISVGLDLSYNAGYGAGIKGHFDAEDIVKAIVGGLATAIGGSLIMTALGGSGALGFGIGLAVAALVTLNGYIEGQRDLEDKNKWGNLTMTREQIETFVEEQFTFDVKSSITVLEGVIENETAARQDLNTKITDFVNSLDDATVKAGISVDSSETGAAVTKAADDARAAIASVESLLKKNNEGISVLMKTFRFENAAGEDITSDLMNQISIADKSVQDYFTDIGRQISYWVTEGETKGWNETITSSALALMEREKKILQKAEGMKTELDFQTKFAHSMDQVIDRDTAREQKAYQEQLLAEYKEKAKEALNTEYDTNMYLAGMAQAAAEDAMEQAKLALENGDIKLWGDYTEQAKQLEESAETYKTAASSALSAIDQIDDQLTETKQNMAKAWAEVIKMVYGEDILSISNRITENEVQSGLLWKWLADLVGAEYNSEFKNEIDKRLNTEGTKGIGAWIRERIIGAVTNEYNDPNGVMKHYFDLGGNLFDFLTDSAKQQIMSNLIDTTGDLNIATEIFKNMFDLENDTSVEKYITTEAVEAVKAAKKRIEKETKDAPLIPGFSYTAPESTNANQEWSRELNYYTDFSEYNESIDKAVEKTEELKEATEGATEQVRELNYYTDFSEYKDAVDDAAEKTEELKNPYAGATKDWLAGQMLNWFPESNVDLLHRKVLEEAGNIETIISETVAASADGSKGIQWNQDLVVNFATITPDGKKLDENEFEKYVDSLFSQNNTREAIIEADKVENGGLGLYLNSYYGASVNDMIDTAVKDAVMLHQMQEEYYKDSILENAEPVELEIKPVLSDETDIKKLYSDLMAQVNSADLSMLDKNDYMRELMYMYTNNDLEAMQRVKEAFEKGWNYEEDLDKVFYPNGSIRNPNNYAATAMPTNQFVYPNRIGAEGDEDLSGDVEKGTRAANKTSEDLIRQGVNYLWQLLNKPTSVTVTPSAAWGRHNAKSNDKYTYVTGVEMV